MLVLVSIGDVVPVCACRVVVSRRVRRALLQTVRGEIRELKRKARELEKVRTYVQKRLAGA